MRLVVCPELGPLSNLRVEERPDLAPADGQVVVDVKAAGVNFVDGLMAQGGYQIKPQAPYTPGMEVAGVVSAVGAGVTGVGDGDRVIANVGLGAFASQVALRPESLIPLPAGLDFARGATVIQSYATAMFTFTRRTTVKPGEWVLVLGAGGGIGLASTDLAVALGAHVIAAASTPEKLAAAVAVGAEATIAYEHDDLKAKARELSGGGVDVVMDPVGGKQSEPALRALRWGGRFCVVGFAAGSIPSIPLNQVLLNNRTVVGVDWGAWTFREPLEQRAMVEELLGMLAEGRLHPAAPAERPLEDAATVMDDLINRRIAGKVVLVP